MDQKRNRKTGGAVPFLSEERPFSGLTAAWAGAFALLWIFTVNETSPVMCLLLGAGLLVAAAFGDFRGALPRMNAQALFVLAYVAMCGVSCLWADAGPLSLTDFMRLLPAFFVYVWFVWGSGRGSFRGFNGASAISALSAFVSLLSIDAVGTRWIWGPFQLLFGLFTNEYVQVSGLETGTRITSITEDPNVYAGIAGIGVLLGLSLALSARGRGERRFHLCCLALNSLGFVLVFSVGAAGYILAAFIVFIVLLGRERRAAGVVLMAETLVVTMLGAMAVYLAVFDGTKQFSVVPLAAMVLCCTALCALERFAAPRVTAALSAHPRAALTAVGAAAALLAVYALAAMNVTGSAALTPGETLRRAAALPAGEYTLSADGTATAQVQIVTQNEKDLIMHTETVLYFGCADGAAFSVPEDSEAVWFRFSIPEGGELSAASYSGAADGSLKLGYKLLPGFIANRLQGLWANQNAVQRVQFWRDGLKLWQRSPIFGNGMAAMEVGLFSVQSFFYQTKYAHNHFVQCLMDTGLIGLALFVGILASSAWLFWKGRRGKDPSPLLPALGAALVFMLLQATMQVDFSTHSFLPVAFGVFALLNVAGAPLAQVPAPAAPAPAADAPRGGKKKTEAAEAPAPAPKADKPPRMRLSRVLQKAYPVFGVLCALALCCHFYTRWHVVNGSGSPFDRLDRAVITDPVYKVNYLQTYVVYALQLDDTQAQQALPDHAARLAKLPINTEPNYAAEYYLASGETEKAVDALVDHLEYNRSRSEAWRYAFDLLFQYYDGTEEYQAQARRVADALDAWEAQAMEPVELSGMNRTYLASLRA